MASIHAASFPERPWSAQTIRAFVKRPGVVTLTRPSGFLLAQCLAPEAEILTLAVDPQHRRCGCGRALVTDLVARARTDAITRIVLEVAVDNAAAVSLYQTLSFSEIGRRKGYYARRDAPAQDALIMARAVT